MARTWFIDPVSGSDTARTVTMSAKAITGASKANPCVITAVGHPFQDGDYAHISALGGMSQINGLYFYLKYVDANNVSLYTDQSLTTPVNSTSYTTYTSGGVLNSGIQKTNPVQVTCPGHGMVVGQAMYMDANLNMTQLRSQAYKVSSVTGNRFTLTDFSDVNIDATGYTANTTTMGTVYIYDFKISGITKANPAVVTCTQHNYSNGDVVPIVCEGMTEMNLRFVTVANKTDTTFECSGVDSSAFGTFTSGFTRKPFLTGNACANLPNKVFSYSDTQDGADVRIVKTFTPGASITVGSGNIVFTKGSATVTTSVDLRASIAQNNFIGLTTAVGTGCWFGGQANDPRTTPPEVYYKVSAITASTITLTTLYSGTTTTVSSVYRLRTGTEIRTIGVASSNGITWSQPNCTISGGWNFSGGVTTRDGETWLSPVTTNADFTSVYISATGCVTEFLAGVNGYRGFMNFYSNTMRYCFASPALYYGLENRGQMEYCSANQSTGNYGCFYTLSGTTTTIAYTDYCYAKSANTSTAQGFQLANSVSYARYCRADHSGRCIEPSSGGGISIGCKAVACSYHTLTAAHSIIIDPIADSCSYGVYCTGGVKGWRCSGYNFTACTYGFYLSQTAAIGIENGTCTSCGRDFASDTYVTDIVVSKHNSVTPTTYAFDFGTSPNWKIMDFTIDALSVAKAFSATASTAGLIQPQYSLYNCPQFPDGQYYSSGSIQKDTADVYSGNAWSLKVILAGSSAFTGSASEGVPLKLFKVPVSSGVGGTVTYRMKRNASWAGSIIPKFWFDDYEIETETEILAADISDSTWTQFTATVANGSIPSDGILTFGFQYKGSVHALNIDFLSGGFV